MIRSHNLPAQRPDETWGEWGIRVGITQPVKPQPLRPHIPVGVGTYDGNGNPKGSNWS